MENEQKPVEQVSLAGEEQKETSPLDAEAISILMDENDKALSAAETKIVALKKKLKGIESGSFEEEDLDSKIERIVSERLQGSEIVREDKEIQEIEAQRKKISELKASLIAQQTTSHASIGANQSKLKTEVDYTKKYSQADLLVLQRIADNRNMTLNKYLETLEK